MRLALLFLAALTLPSLAQTRSVAITVDDLVCANCAPVNPDGSPRHGVLESTNQRLVAGLVAAHIPVTGFVVTGSVVPSAGISGGRALQVWLDAGFDLGSHSDTHPNFADLSTEQMEAEITRADLILRPLMAAHGRELHFFRFPYNDTGDTRAKHDALAAFLKDHGYEVATCTIDTSDYDFAQAYARALGANDTATAARIRREYLDYSAQEIDYYASLSKQVIGYEPPQVMLLHDSFLNADSIADILALFRSRSYSFVSLQQAQSDPAYSTPDTYVKKYGVMWVYRWAEERHIKVNGKLEPEPPAWILNFPLPAAAIPANTRSLPPSQQATSRPSAR